jgi:hypothetical protein
MLFMVIERFRDGKAQEIYQRYQEKGRMMPEGLRYDDLRLFQQWILQWQDLVEFEIIPVVSSSKTTAVTQPML